MDIFKRFIIGGICCLVAFVIGYGLSYFSQKNKYEKQQLETLIEAQEKIRTLESQLQERNAELVDTTIKLNNALNKQQKESVKYVTKLVEKDNPSCPIRVGTLRMYNNSISGNVSTDGSTTGIDDTAKSELVNFSDFTGTVIDNNYEMQKDLNRFKALQEVVKNYQETTK